MGRQRLTDEQVAGIERIFHLARPRDYGLGASGTWTDRLLRALIVRLYGIEYAPSGIRWLRRERFQNPGNRLPPSSPHLWDLNAADLDRAVGIYAQFKAQRAGERKKINKKKKKHD